MSHQVFDPEMRWSGPMNAIALARRMSARKVFRRARWSPSGATAEDIAEVALFFLAGAATITGQTIIAECGVTL